MLGGVLNVWDINRRCVIGCSLLIELGRLTQLSLGSLLLVLDLTVKGSVASRH